MRLVMLVMLMVGMVMNVVCCDSYVGCSYGVVCGGCCAVIIGGVVVGEYDVVMLLFALLFMLLLVWLFPMLVLLLPSL